MKSKIFTLLYIGSCILLNAQTAQLKLYYNINESQSLKNQQRLDSFLTTLHQKSINVHLIGYADFLYNDDYNTALSLKRANNIKDYLAKRTKEPHVNVLDVKAKGESDSKENKDTKGDAAHRRVDLIIESASTNTNVNTRPIQIETPKQKEKAPELISGKPLNDIQIGQSIELVGVSFVPGRHTVLEASVPVMYNLLQTLIDHPSIKIQIQGHVCCVEDFKTDALDYGTGERNLSVSRAKAIFDFLLKHGIDKSRLSYKGFGHKHPKVEPETTPDEEQMNRRVEVMVVEK